MAAVMSALARVTGWNVSPDLELASISLSAHRPAQRVASIDPPQCIADPWLLGRVHEALLQPDERQRAGAHYTPRSLAAGLIGWATQDGATLPGDSIVCDPAVGGGAFLLAAADLLAARGHDPVDIVRTALWGIDLDPVAVAVADAALSHWAWRRGRRPAVAGDHLQVGDALADTSFLSGAPDHQSAFDLVVGNPPFQGQLAHATARSSAQAAALRSRIGQAVLGYTDSAALFLVAGCRLARPGGRVALLQPMSFFAARDASRARSQILEGARLDGVWTGGAKQFAADVRVGAIVLHVDPQPDPAGAGQCGSAPIRRAHGPGFVALPPLEIDPAVLRTAPSWSHLIPATTPDVGQARTAGRLGDIASATAGFRDQFYGLVPFVSEALDPAAPCDPADRSDRVGAPLVTSGLIDPGACRWGQAPARFAGRVWQRPVVHVGDVRAADPRLARWLDRVLVPKVVVACQTRVVEASVDQTGRLVPSVPVIAVFPAEHRLFDIAAVLLAPYTSAWALQRAGGSALDLDAIKLAATQTLEVPLPADGSAWAEGAELLRSWQGRLDEPARFGAIMDQAYGCGGLTPWWLGRLPERTWVASRP